MLSLNIIILICFIHFVADFILQSNKMIQEKSHSIKWLTLHCATYMLPWLFFGPLYAVINGALHELIDFNTSKMTHYLWDKKEIHWFFVVIGFDQFLHISSLLLTYWWIVA